MAVKDFPNPAEAVADSCALTRNSLQEHTFGLRVAASEQPRHDGAGGKALQKHLFPKSTQNALCLVAPRDITESCCLQCFG